MDKVPASKGDKVRRLLLVEELEARIAPSIVVDGSGAGWVLGGPNALGPLGDEYWIFYIGPGQAEIWGYAPGNTRVDDFLGSEGPPIVPGLDIGDIVITGSTMESALFIMDFPGDETPDTDLLISDVNSGTLMVRGRITADSDMGYIAIDGLLYRAAMGSDDVYIDGNLGKLDVGCLLSDVTVTGDIYEIDVDTSIGIAYNVIQSGPIWTSPPDPVAIQANGNIGAIRSGVGLTDSGEGVTGFAVLGGYINYDVLISANADRTSDPATIDLIEVRSGSVDYEGNSGDLQLPGYYASLGLEAGLSAGPRGNIRFVNVDGEIEYMTPAGGVAIQTLFVDASTPVAQRTIVDDSGGVMIISPQNTTFVSEDGLTTNTYLPVASYRLVPVNRDLQGPGAVIANISTDGHVNFNVSGNVEISRFDVATTFPVYPEGIALDEERLGITVGYDVIFDSLSTITSLQGFAQVKITGSGECDVYYLTGGNIPIFINNTRDGDIANVVATGSIVGIFASSRGGDIGATESIVPFSLLKGPTYFDDGDVAWVDVAAFDDNESEPFGIEGSLTRYNNLHGILVGGTLAGAKAGGAIGDIRSAGGTIGLVEANSDNVQDAATPYALPSLIYLPGDIMPDELPDRSFYSYYWHVISPFGKTVNTVGDGVFGRIMTGSGATFLDSMEEMSGGGTIVNVKVGEGLEDTWVERTNEFPGDSYPLDTGLFVSSGIFSVVAVGTVSVSGAGRGIYGDITGLEGDPLTGYGVERVLASKGAVIADSWIQGGAARNSWSAVSISYASAVGLVQASGNGGYIDNCDISGIGVDTIRVSGSSTGGLFDTTVYASSAGLGTISADGLGIIGCLVGVNGHAGVIETTGASGTIDDTAIHVLGSLGRLSTHALDETEIVAVTIGKISNFDYMYDSLLDAGGLRNITIKYDMDSSMLRSNGPLDKVTINGNMIDSDIVAAGFFGQIGTLTVKGSVSGSSIFSNGGIKAIKAGGTLDADITAIGLVGKAAISSGGTATGTWDLGHELASVVVKTGNLAADITAAAIGKLAAAGDVTGDINSIGNVKSIAAGGKIGSILSPSSISVGGDLGKVSATGGGIFTNLSVTGNLSSVKAAGDLGNAGMVIVVGGNAGKMTAGSGKLVGDIDADITVTGNFSGLSATGAITGDLAVGGNLGNEAAKGAITGDVMVTGNAGSIKAGGNVGTVASLFSIGGDLKTLSVGASKSASNVLCDVGIGGSLGSLKVYGNFAAELSVGGDAKSIWIGGDAGQPGDIFGIGGNVGTFALGKAGSGSLSDMLAALNVGGDLKTVKITGDIYDSIDVGGSVNTITLGQVQSADITIGGDLGKITAGSAFLPTPDPHVYDIYTSGLLAGQLTVTGEIKKPPL